MRVEVSITFDCDMSSERELVDGIITRIKPILDFYHTGAAIKIVPTTIDIRLEGAWNG